MWIHHCCCAVLISACAGNLAEEIALRDQGRIRTFQMLSERQGEEAPIYVREKGVRASETSRRRLTERVLVRLAGGVDAPALANRTGARADLELPYLPGGFIFHATSPRAALELAAALRKEPGVLAADPILARRIKGRHVPNDPLFPNAWHLLNTGQNGATRGSDINVTNVWEKYRGAGVTIAVVDDGVLYTHPDLASNVDRSLGIDIRGGDSDPLPEGLPGVNAFDEPLADSHGTAVAGIIGARGDNGLGSAGVAYEATLAAVRLIGGDAGDDQEAEALFREGIDISNNSWGAEDDAETLGGAGELALRAIQEGAARGRGGKGTIYVFAAGNGGELEDGANYDSYANSIHTIAVGAINDRGRKASYSERGTCLIVSAPGGNDASRFQGITTTDLAGEFGYNHSGAGSLALPEITDRDYTQLFNGTSAAAPIVSGVVALMLEANPQLGWRDVQEILIRSATKTHPANLEWITNAAGLVFNPNFGAGLVNADGAVTLATNWTNLRGQTNLVFSRANLSEAISFEDSTAAEISFEIPEDLRVEHVTVQIDAAVAARGGLEVVLESPTGTLSPLAEPREDANSDYDYTFMSVFHWGESARGQWTVRVADSGYFESEPGSSTLRGVTLTLYGTTTEAIIAAVLGPIRVDEGGVHITVSGEAGRKYELERSRELGTWQNIGSMTAPASTFEMVDSGGGSLGAAFYRVISTK